MSPSNGNGLMTVYGSNASVSGTFVKPATTDSVMVNVFYVSADELEDNSFDENSSFESIYHRSFAPAETFNSDINVLLPSTCNNGLIKLELSSPSNIDWTGVEWIPTVQYYQTINTIVDTVSVRVAAKKRIYNKLIADGTLYRNGQQQAQLFKFDVSVEDGCSESGELNLVVRSKDDIYARHQYQIADGQFINDTIYNLILPTDKYIWAECYVQNNDLAQHYQNPSFISLNHPRVK